MPAPYLRGRVLGWSCTVLLLVCATTSGSLAADPGAGSLNSTAAHNYAGRRNAADDDDETALTSTSAFVESAGGKEESDESVRQEAGWFHRHQEAWDRRKEHAWQSLVSLMKCNGAMTPFPSLLNKSAFLKTVGKLVSRGWKKVVDFLSEVVSKQQAGYDTEKGSRPWLKSLRKGAVSWLQHAVGRALTGADTEKLTETVTLALGTSLSTLMQVVASVGAGPFGKLVYSLVRTPLATQTQFGVDEFARNLMTGRALRRENASKAKRRCFLYSVEIDRCN
eukprot:g14271.t1